MRLSLVILISTNFGVGCVITAPPPAIESPAVEIAAGQGTPAVQVFVTTEKSLGRPLEVVGVLDFHTPAETEDKGFDELRLRAAALGADAVIGAEFEHGEGGGPSHLSGLAVRYR